MITEIYDIRVLQNDLTELARVVSRLHFVLNNCSLGRLTDFLKTLRDDLIVGIETDYVDAMYRDEYYHFYATKLHKYDRNCIKMTFFRSGHLVPGQPVDYQYAEEIKDDFLGFLVIRPLQACIGRNVISPEAKKAGLEDIKICRSHVRTTALGLKVQVEGFPHASQDGEMMTCAETSLWSIAEYYGHKYPNHNPICPSEILKAMRPTAQQRQLPSAGLTFEQISVGLCSFGFSTKMYNLYAYDEKSQSYFMLPDMKEVLACYIESGFPLALCLQSNNIGHAVTCTGRPEIARTGKLEKETINGNDYFVWNRCLDSIVLNDDNVPPYQKANMDHPTTYYGKKRWDEVLLMRFLVPLPSKVYLDAFKAVKLSKNVMAQLLNAPQDTVIRTFLASSRSFREHIAVSKVVNPEIKHFLLTMNLPRFVWVSELSSLDEFHKKQESGLILLDATEPTQDNIVPLLMCVLDKKGFIYSNNIIKKLVLAQTLQMESYERNIN